MTNASEFCKSWSLERDYQYKLLKSEIMTSLMGYIIKEIGCDVKNYSKVKIVGDKIVVELDIGKIEMSYVRGSYKDWISVKYLPIYDELDIFVFTLHPNPLDPTEKDYSIVEKLMKGTMDYYEGEKHRKAAMQHKEWIDKIKNIRKGACNE